MSKYRTFSEMAGEHKRNRTQLRDELRRFVARLADEMNLQLHDGNEGGSSVTEDGYLDTTKTELDHDFEHHFVFAVPSHKLKLKLKFWYTGESEYLFSVGGAKEEATKIEMHAPANPSNAEELAEDIIVAMTEMFGSANPARELPSELVWPSKEVYTEKADYTRV
jgi:hypothetical protein